MIRRRHLVASTAACALGIPARAQLPGRAYRIAYFGFTATNSADDDRIVAAFVDRLADLGFVQRRNLTIEWRYAEGKNERYAGVRLPRLRLCPRLRARLRSDVSSYRRVRGPN